MDEVYTEVPTETEDFTASDYFFIGFIGLFAIIIISFILKSIKKTFKNVKFKLGDKIEVNVETKEEK